MKPNPIRDEAEHSLITEMVQLGLDYNKLLPLITNVALTSSWTKLGLMQWAVCVTREGWTQAQLVEYLRLKN